MLWVMKIQITDYAELSNECSASSYGMPVLIANGQQLGAKDKLPNGENTAAQWIEYAMLTGQSGEDRMKLLSAEEQAFVKQFVAYGK
jgi:hypothetical protein